MTPPTVAGYALTLISPFLVVGIVLSFFALVRKACSFLQVHTQILRGPVA